MYACNITKVFNTIRENIVFNYVFNVLYLYFYVFDYVFESVLYSIVDSMAFISWYDSFGPSSMIIHNFILITAATVYGWVFCAVFIMIWPNDFVIKQPFEGTQSITYSTTYSNKLRILYSTYVFTNYNANPKTIVWNVWFSSFKWYQNR